jgi:signal transduction histidine kinase
LAGTGLAGTGLAGTGLAGTGLAGTAQRAGHGIVGMRERVSLCGGEFSAAPRPGGGFVVRARLPLDSRS